MIPPTCPGRPLRAFRARTSRAAALVALLVAGGVLPGTASAAPERGLLVVQGQGNTATDLVLTSEVQLCPPVPVLTGGGGYAGALLERQGASPPAPVGGLQVRAFADSSREIVSPFGADGRLTPGTYRVTLFGQGPVRAEFAMCNRDAPGVEVAPRSRVPVQFLGRAESLEDTRSAAAIHLRDALPAGRRAILVALLTATSADSVETCATTSDRCDRSRPGVTLPQAPVEITRGGQLVDPAPRVRSLRWSVDGVRLERDRLRAAALLF